MVSPAALVLLLSSAVTVAAQPQPAQQGRTVAVSARSEIVVPPDLVLIDFTAAIHAEALNEARSANDELTHTVFQIVHQLEIPSEDFQVIDLAASPIRRVKWEALEGCLVNGRLLPGSGGGGDNNGT